MVTRFTKRTLRAGFEPAREDSLGFQFQRLNHSAITADAPLTQIFMAHHCQPQTLFKGKKNQAHAVNRVRTCAGISHQISSLTP